MPRCFAVSSPRIIAKSRHCASRYHVHSLQHRQAHGVTPALARLASARRFPIIGRMLHRAWGSLVQRGFHALYTVFAPGYDLVAWAVSKGDWQAWGRASLAHLESGPVLELGGGPGHLLPHLAAAHPLAVGVELSPAMLRLARARQGGGSLVRARAQSLPFGDAVFHSVVSVFPAPYIVHPATLAEIERVLADSGRLIIVDDASLDGADPWAWVVNLAYRLTARPLSDSPLSRRAAAHRLRLTRHRHVSPHGSVAVLVGEKAA